MSEVLSAEELRVLNYTQSLRERLVQSMMEGGKMPYDNEDRNVFLKTLDGLDRSAIGTAKLRVENKQADGIANAADIIGQLLTRAPSASRVRNKEIDLELPDDLSVIDLVPGEASDGIKTFSYDQMVATKATD